MIDAAESTQWGEKMQGGGRFLGWGDGLGHMDVSEMMEHEDDGTAALGGGPPVRRPVGAEEDSVKGGKPAATPPGLKSQDGP